MLSGMDFRADVFAMGDRYDRTVRFQADDRVKALETAQREVAALGKDYAFVWQSDDLGRIDFIDMVGAKR